MTVGFKTWMLKEEKEHEVPNGEILKYIKIPIPSVQQQRNYTCGAACLRAICRFYKIGPDTECEFAKAVKATEQDGTEPDNLVRAAKEMGLNAVKKNGMSIKELLTYIDKQWPVICNIQAWGSPKLYKDNDESGHYIVAIGHNHRRIYFEDPSIEEEKRGQLSHKDFEKRWHDKDKNGEKTNHLGIIVWKNSPDIDPQYLVKATKIQ